MSLEQLTLSDEQVQDIVASLIASGDNADAVYDDVNDTLTVSLSDSISVNTLEATGTFTDPSGISYDGSINPLQVTEEASTFTESDVTTTLNGTKIASGSVALQSQATVDDFEDGDTTVKAANWSGWSGDSFTTTTTTVISGNTSAKLTAASEDAAVEAVRNNPTTARVLSTIRIDSVASGNTNDDAGFQFYSGGSSGTDLGFLHFEDNNNQRVVWFDGSFNVLQSSWSPDTNYAVELVWDFPNDQVEIFINDDSKGVFDLRNSASEWDTIQVQNETSSGGDTRTIYFDDVFVGSDETDGDALVEWDSASEDIASYDLATFQRTLDNETVTIDVEDGNENVLFSDISQNFDISTVDTSKEVKLRANLSRNDTLNNPTVDYLARRFNR